LSENGGWFNFTGTSVDAAPTKSMSFTTSRHDSVQRLRHDPEHVRDPPKQDALAPPRRLVRGLLLDMLAPLGAMTRLPREVNGEDPTGGTFSVSLLACETSSRSED
jgi:hypothetical protein